MSRRRDGNKVPNTELEVGDEMSIPESAESGDGANGTAGRNERFDVEEDEDAENGW